MRLPLAASFVSLLCVPAAAQSIKARVTMEDPQQHFFHVELSFDGFGEDELVVALPVWTPGSYKVRDFAQFVEGVAATNGEGEPLAVSKAGKSRWLIPRDGAQRVVLRYDAFANTQSVRFCYLDDSQAFLAPAALLPYVEGHLDLPYELEIVPAKDDWVVDTTLEPLGQNTFRAADYDELADSPVQIGTQQRYPFEVDGVEFSLIVTGDNNLNSEAMTEDMAKIVAETGAIFGGFPFERYLFLLRLGRGGGGLEHADSTALMSSGWRFDSKRGWNGLLNLVAHEFFHAWNVKRIRDEPLGPFDYSKEVYTELLWLHEGWTTYYADLLMRRAGFKTADEMRKSLESGIASYLRRPGRRVQSLAESSYDAWIKHYQTSATTRNSTVDYYGQGAVAALCLDLIVRHNSEGESSLDDVMRSLWDHAKDGSPINPDILLSTLVRFGGEEVQEFWTRHVYGTEEIEFARYLGYAGLEYELDSGEKDEDEEDEQDADGEAAADGDDDDEKEGEDGDEGKKTKPWDHGKSPELGWMTSTDGKSLVVRSLDRGGVAWKAGFAIGDELLGLGDVRVTSSSWPKMLLRHRDAGRIEVLIARGGRLMRLTLPLDGRKLTPTVKKAKEADELQSKVYAGLFDDPFSKSKKAEQEEAMNDTDAKADVNAKQSADDDTEGAR